jgi:hypothetical protein
MNFSVEDSITRFCGKFCKTNNYIDCDKVEKGIDSIVFKATKQNSGKVIWFKIIAERDYKKYQEEWNIVSLLRKFYCLICLKYNFCLGKVISL